MTSNDSMRVNKQIWPLTGKSVEGRDCHVILGTTASLALENWTRIADDPVAIRIGFLPNKS